MNRNLPTKKLTAMTLKKKKKKKIFAVVVRNSNLFSPGQQGEGG